jgi:hypothetical protein
MKKILLTIVVMVFGVALFTSCASAPHVISDNVHKWPDDERNVEIMMVSIQQHIGDGLRSGAFTTDQSQKYLRQLKSVRNDYTQLKGKSVLHAHWNDLHKRLDGIEEEMNRTFAMSGKADDDARNAVRIIKLQQDIDNGKKNEHFNQENADIFQTRLDSIRRDYLSNTEEGRSATTKKIDISSRLDFLTTELNKFQ